MVKVSTKSLITELIKESNEDIKAYFEYLGKGKHNYTAKQKEYALSQIDIYGIRATSRILYIPRRTLQRWCRIYKKTVIRCPSWVYEWAERRRERQEFWQHREYP